MDCPDGGKCHHDCAAPACFRVRACLPLSSHGESWTKEEKELHGQPPEKPCIEDVIVS